MRADFEEMRRVLADKFPLTVEPVLFFGVDALAELLDFEDYRSEEHEVMEWIDKDLRLAIYGVSSPVARVNYGPACLRFRSLLRGGPRGARAPLREKDRRDGREVRAVQHLARRLQDLAVRSGDVPDRDLFRARGLAGRRTRDHRSRPLPARLHD